MREGPKRGNEPTKELESLTCLLQLFEGRRKNLKIKGLMND